MQKLESAKAINGSVATSQNEERGRSIMFGSNNT